MSFYEKTIERQRELSLRKLGFDITNIDQGSYDWHRARLGVITGSRASDLIATGAMAPFPDDVEIVKNGRQNTVQFDGKEFTGTKAECVSFVRKCLPRLPSSARDTYMYNLLTEILTKAPKDQSPSKQTEWGHTHEGTARQLFAFHVGAECHEIPFIYGDESMRFGISPDGIADDYSGLEIKCPFDANYHVQFYNEGKIKSEYIDQVQFSMFVTGLPYWHFCSYAPKVLPVPFHVVTIERDESKMKTFEDAIGQMTHDIDTALARFGVSFGYQWQP